MKKLLLLAVLVLGVVAGIFFVDTTPRVPLAVGIVGVTNLPASGTDVSIWVTNRAAKAYYLQATLQTLSSGEWVDCCFPDYLERVDSLLEAREVRKEFMGGYKGSSPLRIRIRYSARHSMFRAAMDQLRDSLGFQLRLDPPKSEQLITDSILFPAR